MRTRCSLQRFLFLFALLACAANAQQTLIPAADRAAPGDLVLHAELSARTLPPGAALFAGVQLRNVSDHEIGIEVIDSSAKSSPHSGFQMEVTSLDGQPVPMTRWGRQAMQAPTRPAVITLLPGEDQMAVLDVARAFELTQPGDYVLRVSSRGARSIPIVFSLVEGAQPDARKAAVPDPQRDAAAAQYADLIANAPLRVTDPPRTAIATPLAPMSINFTLTNRSAKPVRFGYRNWVRLEVEHPDGRTVEIFGQGGDRDWNQFIGLSTIAPHDSAVFKTTVQDRFTFPAPGNYVLRFWFPRASGAYTLPVTITDNAAH